MTVEEFKEKVEEMRALVTERLTELEENPKWGSASDREELVQSLDELAVQVEALSDMLQGEADDDDDDEGENDD